MYAKQGKKISEYEEIISQINLRKNSGMKLGLTRMRNFMDLLDNPQDKLRYIHVAGTNGKGSVSANLSYLFNKFGYKVGLYTSPYLLSFAERLRIFPPHALFSSKQDTSKQDTAAKDKRAFQNEKVSSSFYKKENLLDEILIPDSFNISEEDFVLLYKKVAKKIANKKSSEANQIFADLSFFELITALAFVYFYEQKCDIVILEVGLGGRLDATNIIKKADLCVISSLGYDHKQILGENILEIAEEKAGILKSKQDFVLVDPEIALANSEEGIKIIDFFRKKTRELDGQMHILNKSDVEILKLSYEGTHFIFDGQLFQSSLIGLHQAYNAALALKSFSLWYQKYKKDLITPKLNKDEFLAKCKESLPSVRWPGRMSFIRKLNMLIDGAHNQEGARSLAKSLNILAKGEKIDLIFGALKDKNIKEMLAEFFKAPSFEVEDIHLLAPENQERSLSVEDLGDFLALYDNKGQIFLHSNISELKAYFANLKKSENSKLLVAWGSLYLMSDILHFVDKLEESF